MKRRIFCYGSSPCCCRFSDFTGAGRARTSAQCAILMDADTGSVLFEQNADERALIASTTKIMTALTVLDLCDPDETVTIPAEATGIEGTSIYLTAGEELTVRELLYGLLLSPKRRGRGACAARRRERFGLRGRDERARRGAGTDADAF